MGISIDELIESLLNPNLNSKSNNAFLSMTDEQMQKVKEELKSNRIVALTSPLETVSGEIKSTINVVFDCKDMSLGNLLHKNEFLPRISSPGPHETINILNLQVVTNLNQLRKLNKIIMRHSDKLAFNLFSTAGELLDKTTTEGKYLDGRDDLQETKVSAKSYGKK